MSDQERGAKEHVSLPLAQAGGEPEAGEGSRSLANWEKLAQARRDLAADDKARASLRSDAGSFLAGYGINVAAFTNAPAGQIGLTSLERQLAFGGKLEREALGVQRCASLVVGPVALAIAGVVAGVAAEVGAVVQVYAANFAFTANIVQSANWVTSAPSPSGGGSSSGSDGGPDAGGPDASGGDDGGGADAGDQDQDQDSSSSSQDPNACYPDDDPNASY